MNKKCISRQPNCHPKFDSIPLPFFSPSSSKFRVFYYHHLAQHSPRMAKFHIFLSYSGHVDEPIVKIHAIIQAIKLLQNFCVFYYYYHHLAQHSPRMAKFHIFLSYSDRVDEPIVKIHAIIQAIKLLQRVQSKNSRAFNFPKKLIS